MRRLLPLENVKEFQRWRRLTLVPLRRYVGSCGGLVLISVASVATFSGRSACRCIQHSMPNCFTLFHRLLRCSTMVSWAGTGILPYELCTIIG